MNEKPIHIQRGKIGYYIFKNSVIVDVHGWQFFSYNIYNNSNRGSLRKFKDKIINSKEGQYDSSLKLMELAMEHKLTSTSATRPKEEWKSEI